MGLGVNIVRLELNYEYAKIDRRALAKLTVWSLAGTFLFIFLGFRFDDVLFGGIFAGVFLGLAVFTGYLAKRSNDAMKHWEKMYNEAIERDK